MEKKNPAAEIFAALEKTIQAKKKKKAETYRDLCSVIKEGLKEKFFIIRHEIGKKLIIEEYEPGVVRYVPAQHVVDCLLIHLQKYFQHESRFALTNEDGHYCIKYWLATTEPIPTPKIVGQLSDPDLVFHRLPFDIDGAIGETPTFDEFFSRCTNAAAIRAWIGSLFFEESDRQQYVWIYGEGGDGKGALTHTLERVFGPSSCSPGIPDKGSSRFWTYQLLGKRLITIPECQHYSFTNCAIFKQLTGGDNVSFEQKGQDTFTARPTCKFLFTSNTRPNIDSARANERRIIYGEVASPTDKIEELLPTSVIEGRMWGEIAPFLESCKGLFLKCSPNKGIIPTNNDVFCELSESNEEHEELLFTKYFVREKKSNYVLSSKLKEIYGLEKLSTGEIRNFQNFIRRKYKCSSGRTKGKPQIRCWFGLRLKTDTEQAIDIVEKNKNHELKDDIFIDTVDTF
jgi:hypothetical protein